MNKRRLTDKQLDRLIERHYAAGNKQEVRAFLEVKDRREEIARMEEELAAALEVNATLRKQLSGALEEVDVVNSGPSVWLKPTTEDGYVVCGGVAWDGNGESE